MIIVQEIKESWEDIFTQLDAAGCVEHKSGVLPSMGSIDDPDFNSSAFFRLTGKPFDGCNRTLILTTAWSSFTYQFFSRLGKHYLLYNGGRNGYLSQNLFPKITTIGEKKCLDIS